MGLPSFEENPKGKLAPVADVFLLFDRCFFGGGRWVGEVAVGGIGVVLRCLPVVSFVVSLVTSGFLLLPGAVQACVFACHAVLYVVLFFLFCFICSVVCCLCLLA